MPRVGYVDVLERSFVAPAVSLLNVGQKLICCSNNHETRSRLLAMSLRQNIALPDESMP